MYLSQILFHSLEHWFMRDGNTLWLYFSVANRKQIIHVRSFDCEVPHWKETTGSQYFFLVYKWFQTSNSSVVFKSGFDNIVI